jgi:HPr kinase/phosphorylase
VNVKRYPSGELVGFSEGPPRLHVELRGIGIINVKDLFGLASVRERKTIDLVIELEHWQAGQAYDRLGLDESLFPIPQMLGTTAPPIRRVAAARSSSVSALVVAR